MLLTELSQLDIVTMCQQPGKITIAELRRLFDNHIEYIPQMECRLAQDARITEGIVECVTYELALIKIQQNQRDALTSNDQEAVQCLVKEQDRASNLGEVDLSLAEIALIKFKAARNSSYPHMDTCFVVPTSNMCKRLFFQARRALSDYRKSISPTNLESKIFLYVNRKF